MQRSVITVCVFALFGLLLAVAGGEGRAGSDPPKKSLFDQCKEVWNDSNAADSCSNRQISTDDGKCVITASCRMDQGAVASGGCSTVFDTTNNTSYNQCSSTVEFSPENTDNISNCNGRLRAGSSC